MRYLNAIQNVIWGCPELKPNVDRDAGMEYGCLIIAVAITAKENGVAWLTLVIGVISVFRPAKWGGSD